MDNPAKKRIQEHAESLKGAVKELEERLDGILKDNYYPIQVPSILSRLGQKVQHDIVWIAYLSGYESGYEAGVKDGKLAKKIVSEAKVSESKIRRELNKAMKYGPRPK